MELDKSREKIRVRSTRIFSSDFSNSTPNRCNVGYYYTEIRTGTQSRSMWLEISNQTVVRVIRNLESHGPGFFLKRKLYRTELHDKPCNNILNLRELIKLHVNHEWNHELTSEIMKSHEKSWNHDWKILWNHQRNHKAQLKSWNHNPWFLKSKILYTFSVGDIPLVNEVPSFRRGRGCLKVPNFVYAPVNGFPARGAGHAGISVFTAPQRGSSGFSSSPPKRC